MKAYLYPHGGSENHGTEAIARTVSLILKRTNLFSATILFSYNKYQDSKYDLNETNVVGITLPKKYSVGKILEKFVNKIFKQYFVDTIKISKLITKNVDNSSFCFSIGGDNYSYKDYIPYHIFGINERLKKKNCKLILLGCSIGQDCLHKTVLKDLFKYDLIIARETITYENLLSVGLKNVKLYPDSAFTLKITETDLPDGFINDATIGINISPMIQKYEVSNNLAYLNYRELIKYIIAETNQQVALIPHVVWEHTNDLIPLRLLYNEFKDTGRVVLISDSNSMVLKYFISKCKLFVGARTHATIAAYSSCVPTLVVGYSVKAKGIAKDLFGTYENYVLPIQEFKSEYDLTYSYKWLAANENKIKSHLLKIMPSYIEFAENVGSEIRSFIIEKS